MGLETADGKPLDIDVEALNQQFAQTMAAPAEDEPAAAAPPRKRPDAPESRQRPRKSADDKPRTRTPRTAAAGKPAESAQAAQERRATGIAGIFQMAGVACMAMDTRAADSDLSWRADAAALGAYAEPMGQAVADAAKSSAQFAAIVDKLTAAGPYTALVTVTLSLGAQLARNHGVTVAGSLGAVPPEKLLAGLDETAQAA